MASKTTTAKTKRSAKAPAVQDADNLPCSYAHFGKDKPLKLDSGMELSPFTVAYATYGTLNADKTNDIVVCHALTGDQFCAGTHPITGKPGWWEMLIGPGKPVDTGKYFIICANVIGGCMGSTGPASTDAATGKLYGHSLPVITVADMVRAQAMLLDYLEIPDLFCVMGGSMGGMQVLDWATKHTERVFSAIPIATATKHSAQNIAFHEVGRQAVLADPDWHGGDYHEKDTIPHKGLAVARMAAHITYLSEAALHRKFGRNLQDRDAVTFGFDADFQVESYLRYQGSTFVDRFDANSYLYLTRAMDYFDLAADFGGNIANAFERTKTRYCIVSFTSDWLFPASENRQIVRALNGVVADAGTAEIDTDKGHDSFLLDVPELFEAVSGFLNSAARQRGLRD